MAKNHKDAFKKKSIKVPFFYPSISKKDIKSVIDALKSPLLTDGPKLREFEKKFAKFTNAKYAIGVSNATSALQLSLKAIGVGPGDEVIIPNMTFVATASSVLLTGATPRLVDVDLEDMNISIESIKKNITNKTKAIIPVHFAGKACKIQEIKKISQKNKISIIEDCAHAIGAKVNNKSVGTFGDAGCFSFYPTKNITTIEGGMIITNNKKLAQYVESARNHGISKNLTNRYSSGKPWDYDIKFPGYNFRLDEIRSTLGISQLSQIKKFNLNRINAYKYYNKEFGKIKGIKTPSYPKKDNVCHLYILKIEKEFGVSRDELFKMLLKNGIRTSVHYKPLNKFSVFKLKAKIKNSLKNSEELFNKIISIPFFPDITKKEQNYVIKNIQKIQR